MIRNEDLGRSYLFCEWSGRNWSAGETAISQAGRVLLLDDIAPFGTARCAMLPAKVYGMDLSHLPCIPRLAYESLPPEGPCT